MAYQVDDSVFQGEPAIRLTAGAYEAFILPHIGGNLISFRDVEKNYRFLREPSVEEMEAFKQSPTTYGIPVLFPPNRFEDGKFTIGNQTYQFPVNEPNRNNHLHGFLHSQPFDVIARGVNEQGAFVVLAANIDASHQAYEMFPHAFCLTLEYSLSERGLTQTVNVQNMGTTPMPCMLGFHTAVNAPFAPNSQAEDMRFGVTIGKRWEMTDRMLPTGNEAALSNEEQKFAGDGGFPYFAALDNHYTAQPVNGKNMARIMDAKEGVTLVYDVGLGYKNWMVWNNFASGKIICPEPQINLVNAPNTNVPAEEAGLVMLSEGELWTETSRLYVEPLV